MALSRVSGTTSKRPYTNADGPGGSTNDYGPRRAPDEDVRRQQLMDQYGSSGYYGRQNSRTPMPAIDPNGMPRYTPNAGDPRNAGYFVPEPSAQQQAQWQGMQDTQNTAQRAAFAADPGMSAARGAGDMRGYIAARQALQQQGQQQRFIDQGGTPETWARRNDPNAGWPVPGSSIGYQYGPGRPGPTPPGVAGNSGGGGGGRGGLIEGYIPDAGQRGMASTGQGSAQPQGQMLGQGQATNMIGSPEDMARAQAMSQMRQAQGVYGRDNITNWMQQQQGGGMGGGQAMNFMDPRMSSMGGGQAMNYPMMETQRTFPGGVTPTNPGDFGGRPVQPGYPTTPYPGSFPGTRLPGPPGSGPGYGQMSPFQPGQYGGQLPMDLMGGMQQFGYQPYGGGYNQQAQNPFAAMFGGGYY